MKGDMMDAYKIISGMKKINCGQYYTVPLPEPQEDMEW